MLNRRTFLKGSAAGGVLAVAAAAGLLRPTQALAAAWPQAAFDAKSTDDSLKSLFGSASASESTAITITAPLQAENGAVVPIAVTSTLAGVEAITVLAEGNASPLIATANLSGAEPYFKARMKLAKTADVKVVIKAGGKLHVAKQNIKVTVGGCGG